MVKRTVKEYRNIPTSDEQLYNNLTFKLSLSTETKSHVKVGLKTQISDHVVYNTSRIKERNSFILELLIKYKCNGFP